MPKTTKRTATKRAARIAKAHATELAKLEVKAASPIRRSPGYKPPKTGIARYPLAVALTVLLLALGVYLLDVNHFWPFLLPKAPPKAAVVPPCLSKAVLSQITDVSPAPGPVTISNTTHTYAQAPAMSIDTKKVYCAGFNTNRGLIVV